MLGNRPFLSPEFRIIFSVVAHEIATTAFMVHIFIFMRHKLVCC